MAVELKPKQGDEYQPADGKVSGLRVCPQIQPERESVSDSGRVQSSNSSSVRQAFILDSTSHGKLEPQTSEQRDLKEGSVG